MRNKIIIDVKTKDSSVQKSYNLPDDRMSVYPMTLKCNIVCNFIEWMRETFNDDYQNQYVKFTHENWESNEGEYYVLYESDLYGFNAGVERLATYLTKEL